MTVLILIALFWVLPIYVAHQIGAPKNRNGAVWGVFLSWLGVLVVALLPYQDKKPLRWYSARMGSRKEWQEPRRKGRPRRK